VTTNEDARADPSPYDRFVAQHNPNRPILDTFVTSAVTRTEHYEIAAYTSLITMADALGETKASTLLQRNLKQEVAALAKATRIATRFARKIPSNA
jgi:ferritin-like metal-binding protein YciE